MKLDVQSLSVTLGDTTIVKEASFAIDRGAVSYTHLTLPTIA